MTKTGFFKKSVCVILCLVVVLAGAFMMAACDEDIAPSITLTPSRPTSETLAKNSQVTFAIATSDGGGVTLSVDNTDLAQIEGNVLTILKDVTTDTQITVTAKHNDYQSVVASLTFTVKAPVVLPTITMSATKGGHEVDTVNDKLVKNDVVTISATSSDNGAVALSVDKTSLASLDGNTLTIIGDIRYNEIVTVTATLISNEAVKQRLTFTVKAPVVNGAVGDLTSAMIEAIGDDELTVEGKVTDIYRDLNTVRNNSETEYYSLVKMSTGAWYGAWAAYDELGNRGEIIEDNYRMNADTVTDQYGNTGHSFSRVYIDQHNEVASKLQKDYLSIPAVWEAQHLYNHLANLDINKFEQHTMDGYGTVYKYNWKTVKPDGTIEFDEADIYLMTYLSYALTPMLGDTLDLFCLIVENGEITSLVAQTETIYDSGAVTDAENASYYSYTTVELNFSNVGNTTVPDPTKYEAPENVELLANAINTMKNATSYTFTSKDRVSFQASGDSGDYEIDAMSAAVTDQKYENYPTNKPPLGGDGLWGMVTQSSILLENTSSYQYYSDYQYTVKYSGYKQVDATHYDTFEYDTDAKQMKGLKKYNGTIADVIPNWDFSAEVFEFTRVTSSGYVFTLRDGTTTRDIAMATSMHSSADDATQSTQGKLTITVDDAGNIVSISYPYDFDTQAGTITTTFENVNSTVESALTFENYIPRVLPTTWADYVFDDYYYLHDNRCSAYGCYDEDTQTYNHEAHVKTGDVVIANQFGANAAYVPSVELMFKVFNDDLTQCWVDWKNLGTEDEPNYSAYLSINWHTKLSDENSQVDDATFQILYDHWVATFGAEGYMLDTANTYWEKGSRADREICFVKGDATNGGVQIRIENNHTSYCFITIYNFGAWSLAK